MRVPTSLRDTTPALWLGLVAVTFGTAQLLVMDMGRYLAWDEAVYYAEVNPRVDPIGFYAHRARGVTLVAAPMALISDSVFALRLSLVAISSLGLLGAFSTWRSTASWAAPVAAALFGSSWLALAYGSELMPNYYSALLAVAAIGLSLAYLHNSEETRLLVLAGIVVALATLVRPLDGAVLVLIVSLAGLLFGEGGHGRLLAGSVLGAAAGGLPWVVEAWVRFGGPLERLELTSGVVGGSLTNNAGRYLEMLAAPLSSGEVATSPQLSAAWILSLLALSAAATALTSGRTMRVAVSALLASGLLVAPYMFYYEAAAPRFMTPGVALLSVAAAIGVTTLFQRERPSAGRVVAALAVAGLVAINLTAATQWSSVQTELRGSALVLGEVLAERSAEGPCYFRSSYGYPQISVASGCSGARLTSDAETNLEHLDEAIAAGADVYALVASDMPTEPLDAAWDCTKVARLPESRWHLCEPGA